ncbi:MAG: hypothetical protein AMS27_09985 [Bacteroides sp. SM23_62_1]|nr:MAG: hypothetical protein AMS27_09985 [Bacteroides sp. SM23_62_1]
MAEKDLQKQINEINDKLDEILICATQQRLRSEMMDDLLADLSIIGKDVFRSTVTELDKQGIELNVDDLKTLSFKIIRNLDKFSDMLSIFESIYDLMEDLSPVVREMIIDLIKKLHALEKKGYFEFFAEMFKIVDNIVTNYKPEDVRLLADNIVTIMDTIKNMTQPQMLQALNNAVHIYQKLDMENIPEYSIWKAMKEMRTPEMKRGIGFLITFLKNLTAEKALPEKTLSN